MGGNICSAGKKNNEDTALMELEWARRVDQNKSLKSKNVEVQIVNTMESSITTNSVNRFPQDITRDSLGTKRSRQETYDIMSAQDVYSYVQMPKDGWTSTSELGDD